MKMKINMKHLSIFFYYLEKEMTFNIVTEGEEFCAV